MADAVIEAQFCIMLICRHTTSDSQGVTDARGRRTGRSDECVRVLRIAVFWPELPL